MNIYFSAANMHFFMMFFFLLLFFIIINSFYFYTIFICMANMIFNGTVWYSFTSLILLIRNYNIWKQIY